MAPLHIELLRGLALTKLEHLQLSANVGATLTSARALALARLAATSALVLLWFAGELERLALTEDPDEDGEMVLAEEEDISGSGFDEAEPLALQPLELKPMRCRWCPEYVVCRSDGEVVGLDQKRHVCSLKKRRTSGASSHPKGSRVATASRRASASSQATSSP